MNTEKKTAVIIGIGYLGLKLANELLSLGYIVFGTTRNTEKKSLISENGFIPILWDRNASNKIDGINPELIISTVAPNERGDEIISSISDYLKSYNGWLGYISATSVYGGNKKVFDEYSKCSPNTIRGERRLKAENSWFDLGSEIFRVAGIYGPEKSFFQKLKDKQFQLVKKENHVFNRIHIDDLVGIILKCIGKPRKYRIINVSDGNPCSQIDFFKYASKVSNFDLPKIVTLEDSSLSDMAKSFWKSSKIVNSRIIFEDLKYKFKYPDYKSGLKNIWELDKKNII